MIAPIAGQIWKRRGVKWDRWTLVISVEGLRVKCTPALVTKRRGMIGWIPKAGRRYTTMALADWSSGHIYRDEDNAGKPVFFE